MGYIYLYVGTGAGKTVNGLGLALRSVGHGHSVVIVQFMKSWANTGEYKIMKKLRPKYKIYLFGRKGWINFKNPAKEDKALAKKALLFAQSQMKKAPHLLFLDELALAANYDLVSRNDVMRVLRRIPEKTDVVITGRYCPKWLLARADFVNEVTDVKAPSRPVFRKGINY